MVRALTAFNKDLVMHLLLEFGRGNTDIKWKPGKLLLSVLYSFG